MTTAPQPALSPEQEQHLRLWSEALEFVLGQVTGKQGGVTPVADPSPAPDGAFTLQISYQGSLSGEEAIAFPVADAIWLAGAFVKEGQAQEVATEIAGEQKEALEELVRQVTGRLATALKTTRGDVQLQVAAVSSIAWETAGAAHIEYSTGDGRKLQIYWRIDPDLAKALIPAPAPAAVPADDAPAPVGGSANLTFLQDVMLGVTLRFGERRMLLREILELVPGSVIELDRRLHEPVELLLDGRLLAKGEVVVIDGCYGLKVTEVTAHPGIG